MHYIDEIKRYVCDFNEVIYRHNCTVHVTKLLPKALKKLYLASLTQFEQIQVKWLSLAFN